MRILLVNPNTSPNVTELLTRHARQIVADSVELVPVTGRFGARYISSRAAVAIAAHAALDAVAEHSEGVDAVFLACFGDPGLQAVKELSPVPVVGMAEAACTEASLIGPRFAIVTGGSGWGPMLTEFVGQLGMATRLAAVRCLAQTGGDIARDPAANLEALRSECTRAVEEDGADVVILAGTGLAGLASELAPSVPAPLVCSVEAGIRATVAIASLPRASRPDGLAATPSRGLSRHLAAALGL